MKKFLLFLGFSLLSFSAISQWTWQNRLPQGNYLKSVDFTDANTGFAVGGGYQSATILKTTDGGSSWNIVVDGPFSFLSALCFPDANTGYAVGGAVHQGLNMDINSLRSPKFEFHLVH